MYKTAAGMYKTAAEVHAVCRYVYVFFTKNIENLQNVFCS